jgi:hypothetical protein
LFRIAKFFFCSERALGGAGQMIEELGQVGAKSDNKIEVTPEMIEAGARAARL